MLKDISKRTGVALVVMVLLAGLGTAALLDYYGQIDGTATVDQSTLVDGEAYGDMPIKYSFDGEDPKGKTYIEVHELESRADVPETVNFTTLGNGVGGGDQGPNTSMDIDWTGGMEGVDTRYVEVFDDAGASASSYEAPETYDATVTSSDLSDLQDEIENHYDGGNEVIIGVSGTYSGTNLKVYEGITLISKDERGAATIEANVEIVGSDVVIDGLDITHAGNSVIQVDAQEDDSNHNVVFGSYSGIDGVVIQNNKITGSKWTGIHTKDADDGGTVNGLEIRHNTIDVIGEPENGGVADAIGIGLNFDDSDSDTATIENNTITTAEATADGYTSAGVKVIGDTGETVTISSNNLVGEGHYDVQNVGDSTVTATDNWFGTDNIQTEGGVDADWKTKTDMTLTPGETDEFGVLNDFQPDLKPGDYTIKTNINPAPE